MDPLERVEAQVAFRVVAGLRVQLVRPGQRPESAQQQDRTTYAGLHHRELPIRQRVVLLSLRSMPWASRLRTGWTEAWVTKVGRVRQGFRSSLARCRLRPKQEKVRSTNRRRRRTTTLMSSLRFSVLRGRPPGRAGGIIGPSRAHSASRRSLGCPSPFGREIGRCCSSIHIAARHHGEARYRE